MQPDPNQVFCLDCKGGNAPDSTACQWCGHLLPVKVQAPPFQPAIQVQSAQAQGSTNCVGMGLVIVGVVLVAIVQALTFLLILGGGGRSAFQEQSIISLGILLSFGAFAVLVVPGGVLLVVSALKKT